MNLAKPIEVRTRKPGEPTHIRFSFKNSGLEIAHIEGVYGSASVVSDWLGSVYAYGLADLVAIEEGPVGIVSEVEVAPDHRRGGLGRALVQRLVGTFQQHGVQVVFLQASQMFGGVDESILVRFYEQAGFQYCCRTQDGNNEPVLFQVIDQ